MHVDKTERDRRKVHQKHWQKLSGLKKLANSSSIIRRILKNNCRKNYHEKNN
uniref:Uncharacterized protein LOC105125483 n=1 Tax=Rhizophora mucronata TaxID=61149 RepID=A0A2P2JK76_RHIMU